jgi:hypothetical protein
MRTIMNRSNVWLTHRVKPHATVTIETPSLRDVGRQFDVIEASFVKLTDHVRLVVFEHDQIHGITSGNGCEQGENEAVETGVRLLARVPLRGGPGA